MKNNPFVLPGFGQAGPMGENPILASMEMMRQAWEGLASSGGMDAQAMGQLMSVEEMDKRISDLRAVENWLRMNLSMLGSTIQGLEVQRATVATLKSFVETGLGTAATASTGGTQQDRPRGHSPLEEALKAWPGSATGGRQSAGPAAQPAASRDSAPSEASDASAGSNTPEGADSPESSNAPDDQADVLASAAGAAQSWWNLMQQQFQTLAAATAASAEGAMTDFQKAAEQASEQSTAATGPAARKSTAAKTAAKKASKASTAGKAAKTARTTTSPRAAKKSSKSTTPRKTGR